MAGSKLCPMRPEWGECLEERCRWWIEGEDNGGECTMALIPFLLAGITDMKDKA